jgi:hypothetical protein
MSFWNISFKRLPARRSWIFFNISNYSRECHAALVPNGGRWRFLPKVGGECRSPYLRGLQQATVISRINLKRDSDLSQVFLRPRQSVTGCWKAFQLSTQLRIGGKRLLIFFCLDSLIQVQPNRNGFGTWKSTEFRELPQKRPCGPGGSGLFRVRWICSAWTWKQPEKYMRSLHGRLSPDQCCCLRRLFRFDREEFVRRQKAELNQF